MKAVESGDLLYERQGRVAWVTFNRPDARNAMTFDMSDGCCAGSRGSRCRPSRWCRATRWAAASSSPWRATSALLPSTRGSGPRSRARSATARRPSASPCSRRRWGWCAREILIRARLVAAPEAKTLGLADEVYPAAELEARVREQAEKLTEHAPLTMAAVKEATRRVRDVLALDAAEDIILSCYLSQDFKEGAR